MKKLIYTLVVLTAPILVIAQTPKPWLLRGNSGIDTSINFLGTKDEQPLVFRVNNQKSGLIDLSSTANTSFGYKSLKKGPGINNTAFGYQTLTSNTIGQYNVAVGSYAMFSNTTGLGNTALGPLNLFGNTTGSFNTALGENAMIGNTTGSNNVAVGNQTLAQNKTGTDNAAFGSLALYWNNGTANTAIGSSALYDNTTGSSNTGTGEFALFINTSGNNNTANGTGSLFNNSTGNNNTAVGNSALSHNQNGSNNTALGYNADVTIPNLVNATVIGFNAAQNASNSVRIGNTSVLSIGGQVGWTNFSDERTQSNTQQNVPGLKFIKQLKPVTYHYNITKENQLLNLADTLNWTGKYDLEKISFSGLVAQQVDSAARKVNYNFSGVDKSGKIWGLRYAEFIPSIIKSLQELNDSLQTVAQNQQQVIADLTSRLDKLEAMVSAGNLLSASPASSLNATSAISARLNQNVPNPFSNSTTISYYLPQKIGKAYLNFYSSTGVILNSIQLRDTGHGSINLTRSQLSPNVISYALVIDNKIVDSKKIMQLNK